VIKENAALGVSFELPDRLTVDQLDDYQTKIGQYLAEHQGGFLSNVRYRAMAYAAAVEAGIITNWQCATMPDLRPADVGAADARVISFVGLAVDEYITTYTTISPK
jgi:hypothetical protein